MFQELLNLQVLEDHHQRLDSLIRLVFAYFCSSYGRYHFEFHFQLVPFKILGFFVFFTFIFVINCQENPAMPMINRGPQFHSGVRSTLSKSGTSIGAVNRKEYGKLQPPRTLKRPKNMKIGTQQTRVSSPALLIRPSSPVQFEEAENDFLEVSALPGSMKDCFATKSRAQNNLPHRMNNKDFLTTKRVDDERDYAAKLGLGSTSKAEGKGNMSKMGRGCGDQGCLKAKKRSSRKHENASIKSPEMNLHILHEDDKENLYGVEKQVDSLSRNIGALDLSSDVMTALREKRGRLLATEHH